MRHTFILLVICLSACRGGDQCLPGQRDCTCSALGACNDGLDCHQNVCVRPQELTVQILSSEARACEFVVVDGATQLTSVRFDDSVRGASVRRGRRTAVTVISSEDRPIGSGVSLGYLEGDEPLTLEQTSCFDRQGESLGGGLVTL